MILVALCHKGTSWCITYGRCCESFDILQQMLFVSVLLNFDILQQMLFVSVILNFDILQQMLFVSVLLNLDIIP